MAGILGDIQSAYDAGNWDMPGLKSSTAAGNATTLGYHDNSDGEFSSFDGMNVGANVIIVKYTWDGDTNLDGKVDTADYTAMTNGNGSSWGQGDLNYDGVKDASDWALYTLGDSGKTVFYRFRKRGFD